MVPLFVTTVFLLSIFGLWYVSAIIVGLVLLYIIIEVIILICFKSLNASSRQLFFCKPCQQDHIAVRSPSRIFSLRNSFQLWALQRPWNFLVRLLLPPVEIIDSIGAGNTDNTMFAYRNWGQNLCASGQVWLGSHADVSKALLNPQARNHWLGEHPLYRGSLPEGESGRCVFLLSLSGKAAGGTGDHEAFRQCMIDTLFTDAARVRETDEMSQQLIHQTAEDFLKQGSNDFYYGTDGGNTVFWTKYLHHVLFALDIEES